MWRERKETVPFPAAITFDYPLSPAPEIINAFVIAGAKG